MPRQRGGSVLSAPRNEDTSSSNVDCGWWKLVTMRSTKRHLKPGAIIIDVEAVIVGMALRSKYASNASSHDMV